MNRFYGLVSIAEAADLVGLKDASALRHAISDGRFYPGVDCMKFGKQWVFTVESLCRVYGSDQPKVRYFERYGRGE